MDSDGTNADANPNNSNNLQQRRPHQVFFRSDETMDDDDDAGRIDSGGSPLSEALWHMVWSLFLNGCGAMLLVGVVEAVVLPVLLAVLELTPPSRLAKLLTVLLTAFFFQAGAQGSMILLGAVGVSSLAMVLAQWEDGFVSMCLVLFVGTWTVSRAGVHGRGGGGVDSVRSTGESSAASGVLKAISERDASWRSWRSLWGA